MKGTSLGATDVGVRVRIGVPDREILAEAAENRASLVVIGTHGSSGVRRGFFGSTAARVIAKATLPVLALPPPTATATAGESLPVPLPMHRLLVAVDFTTECMKAIRQAGTLASRWKLPLTLVHAVPTGPGPERWQAFLHRDRDKRIERARRELELLAAEIASERVVVRVIAVAGAPEEIVARYAAEEPGTLIVMGLRAPSLLPPGSGSTAYRLLCISPSPVLVLPDVERGTPRDASRKARARQRV